MTRNKKIMVSLRERSYPVFIGRGLSTRGLSQIKSMPSRNGYVIFDKSLKKIASDFKKTLKIKGWVVKEIPVQAGEGLKTLKSINKIYGNLLKLGARRDSVIFALGGGSVGDAVGFVASTYLRGVKWVGVPTTLLAQVDSSIGGKTAVNHEEGKNLIGTFYQPSAVICELNYLSSLSRREMISGLGEVLKYALVFDPPFFRYLKRNWTGALQKDSRVLTEVIQKSLAWKAKVVSMDEYDTKGHREILNFGHTFGHALEKATGFKKYQHGEAVIWGMRFALTLSYLKERWPKKDLNQLDDFMRSISLPALPRNLNLRTMMSFMAKDKKVRKGFLHFVILKKLGQAVVRTHLDRKDFQKAFNLVMGFS